MGWDELLSDVGANQLCKMNRRGVQVPARQVGCALPNLVLLLSHFRHGSSLYQVSNSPDKPLICVSVRSISMI